MIGIFAWAVAIFATVASLARAGAPRLPLLLIGLGGLAFGLGHPAPTGTVGMAFFLVGTVMLEFGSGRRLLSVPRQSAVPAGGSAD